MTHDEKRRLAVARELELLRETVARFDQVVADAQRLAAECRGSLARFDAIQRDEDRLDAAIENLDRLTGRGAYRETIADAASRAYFDYLRKSDSLSGALVDIARTPSSVVPFPTK